MLNFWLGIKTIYNFKFMKKIILIFIVILVSCKQEVKTDDKVETETESEEVQKQNPLLVYNFEKLEPILNFEDDKIYVINFWATWCAPCIKELPYFEQLNAEYKDNNVEVVLVSLDFPKQFESKLKPFIEKHNLKSKIIALDDVDSNKWIPKISKEWSGAIPATLIYSSKNRQFYEQSFNFDELVTTLKHF